jgi:hypothetical protein
MKTKTLHYKKQSIGVINSTLDSCEKKEVRDMLVDSIKYKDPTCILTFGGLNMWDATLFFRKFPNCRIISIERDPAILKAQKKRIKPIYNRVFTMHYEFSNFVDQAPHILGNDLDLAFLDFNCVLSRKLEDGLEKFLTHVNKDAIIGLTLVAARDSVAEIEDTYCFQEVCNCREAIYRENRSKVIAHTVKALGKRNGRVVQQIGETKCYQNREREKNEFGQEEVVRVGTPMMFWMFRVVK